MTACIVSFSVCVWIDLVAYIAFAWLTPIKTSVVVGNHYKSLCIHHTARCQYCYVNLFHCRGNILIHPLCLFACLFCFFNSYLLSVSIKTDFFCVCLWFFWPWVFYLKVIFPFHVSVSSQYRYTIPHNPWQSRHWPLWNRPGSRATYSRH